MTVIKAYLKDRWFNIKMWWEEWAWAFKWIGIFIGIILLQTLPLSLIFVLFTSDIVNSIICGGFVACVLSFFELIVWDNYKEFEKHYKQGLGKKEEGRYE